jgi:hypothetical protein
MQPSGTLAVSSFYERAAMAAGLAATRTMSPLGNVCNARNAFSGSRSQVALPSIVEVRAGIAALDVFADPYELWLHVVRTEPAGEAPVVERLALDVPPG